MYEKTQLCFGVTIAISLMHKAFYTYGFGKIWLLKLVKLLNFIFGGSSSSSQGFFSSKIIDESTSFLRYLFFKIPTIRNFADWMELKMVM